MIRAESLSFTYPDGTLAVADVDLRVRPGEFVALMGANGCGKTTLLKLLIGLLKPSSGRIFLEGRNYLVLKDRDIFKHVGMLFQDPNDQLFASTVQEDIAFGVVNQGLNRQELDHRVEDVMSTLGISNLRNKAIHALSYGQKRRVALAGVLAMKPAVILLDEPTGGLDPLSVKPVMSLLKRLNRDNGIAMVMATHDVDLVPLYCDSVVVMRDGRVVAQDRPSQILGNPVLTRQASLRLPRVAHLIEILQKEDGLNVEGLPLTIGDARRELSKFTEHGARNEVEVVNRS